MKNEYWESLSKGERYISGTLALLWLGATIALVLWLARIIYPSFEQGLWIFIIGTFSFLMFAGYQKYLKDKAMMMLKKELQNSKLKTE